MIHYEGKRTPEGCEVTRVEDGEEAALPPRLDLWNHSPAGFNWGYGGSGPAQLSLALLADALGDDERASRLHQDFKWEVVSRLPRAEWQLLPEDVQAAAERLEAERGQPREEDV